MARRRSREILNLMARRNLLFEAVPEEEPAASRSASGSARRRSPEEARSPETFALSVAGC